MNILHIDFESRSLLDLPEVGLDNYARHPSTKVLMLGYAFDDEPVNIWEPDEEVVHQWLRKALADPKIKICAWNSTFERYILKYVLGFDIPYDRFIDPMIWARALSFPGSLEKVGGLIGLSEDEVKIKDGKRLITLFCSPFTMGGKETLFGISEPAFHTKHDRPQDWEKFKEYCKRDVEVERTLYHIMEPFQPPEIEYQAWQLDQKINDTGMPINLEFVRKALQLAERSHSELDKILKEKTGLDNPNSRAQLLPWAINQGYPFNSLQKAEVAAAIKNSIGVNDLCKEVLTTRQEAAKTSHKKFETMLMMANEDGYLRNQFLFNGAGRTGRWSGTGVQVHNMPRPTKAVEKDVDSAIQLIENLDYEGIQKKYGSVIDTVGSCVRSAFQAHDGDVLHVCDLSAIENRVLGWVSGCDAILDVFRKGLDPYVAFAVKMYKQPYDVLIKDKVKRQIAKPAVLGAGYMLGGGKLETNSYGDTVKTGLWGYAENMGVKMTQEEAHLSVKIFRDSYPEVVQYWRDLQSAAINTIRFGVESQVGVVTFDYVDTDKLKVMRIILPSGRPLHYLNPRLEQITKIFKTREGEKEVVVDQILYDGMGHGVGKVQNKWGPVKTYSGKICENIVQAISRDILLNGMFLADEMGAKIVGHVHDEILALSRKDDPFAFNYFDLKACMSESPIWAQGLPLAADGYTDKFYRKG